MYKIIGADLKEYGPVSTEQLRQWIVEGRVNGQTRVQAADTTEWKAMEDCPEFADVLPKRPAPSATPAIPITPMPAQPRTSQMAVWAMVTGIGSLTVCCCLWYIAAPVAIVLGAVALSQLKRHPELTGRGFALAAIIIGILAMIIFGAFTAFCLMNPDFFQNLQNQMPH